MAKPIKRKTIAQEIERAATLLQKLVRMKAADDNGYAQCVTCKKIDHWSQLQGGHFIARRHKKWKLEEENVHPQCAYCNGFGMKFGNAEAAYTTHMIDTYGRDFVDHMLATKTESTKMTRADIDRISAEFKEQIKHHERRIA